MVRSLFRAPVSETDYVQRVRRHPPSSLLELIARVSSRMPTKRDWPSDPHYRPWALADAAMTSLVRGNEHRGAPATDGDLSEILAQYTALDDPVRQQPVGERLEGYLLRVAGQQFTWQEDDFSELARSVALLAHTKPSIQLEVLTNGWEQDLLGCSVGRLRGARAASLHGGDQPAGPVRLVLAPRGRAHGFRRADQPRSDRGADR